MTQPSPLTRLQQVADALRSTRTPARVHSGNPARRDPEPSGIVRTVPAPGRQRHHSPRPVPGSLPGPPMSRLAAMARPRGTSVSGPAARPWRARSDDKLKSIPRTAGDRRNSDQAKPAGLAERIPPRARAGRVQLTPAVPHQERMTGAQPAFDRTVTNRLQRAFEREAGKVPLLRGRHVVERLHELAVSQQSSAASPGHPSPMTVRVIGERPTGSGPGMAPPPRISSPVSAAGAATELPSLLKPAPPGDWQSDAARCERAIRACQPTPPLPPVR